MKEKYYLKIGTYNDLSLKKDRIVYRLLEIMPGFLAWGTLLLVIALSAAKPIWIAVFIIAFDTYWLIKTIFLSFHLRSAYRRMTKTLKTDWMNELQRINTAPEPLRKTVRGWKDIRHLVIFPMYKEEMSVVWSSFEALTKINYPLDKLIVVLATEERAGDDAKRTADKIRKHFKDKFHKLVVTCHPKDIPGELAGKGSNQTWAARKVKEEFIDPSDIPYENIIVSVFDVDTNVLPGYFTLLTYKFLMQPNPLRVSFQPIPLYINNIWEAPALARVISFSATFWHMMQQERPERQTTFSSHSMSFKTLVDIDFWQTNIVSEDSRIFWQCYLYYDGEYRVEPMYYPVSMDANVTATFWRTIINQYKQQRRWGWGVENVPYFIFGFWKNKKIAVWKKIRFAFMITEGFHSWATNAILIFLLGWLPLYLGGERFNQTIISYQLPEITRTLMILAMVGIVTSAFMTILLLPHRPKQYGKYRHLMMLFQWIMLPFSIIIFGAFPGLEAQTRLMLGKYMGFWVTEKVRKTK